MTSALGKDSDSIIGVIPSAKPSSQHDLLGLTRDLVAIPSLSHHEAKLADWIEQTLSPCNWLKIDRVENNVVARTHLGRSSRVIIAGHLDTVPPNTNATALIKDDVLWGVGSADMKGGLAVMVDLACSVSNPQMDVTWCFYTCEEVSRTESGLARLWEIRPDLLAADAAILGEPTSCRIEAGCQGTLRAVIRMGGVRAHSARPSTGCNAIHRLGPILETIVRWNGRRVTIDGCEFVEQLQAVSVNGGVAGNVIPDEAALTINYRFAPDKDLDSAVSFLKDLFGDLIDPEKRDSFEVIDEANGALPKLDHPILASLVDITKSAPRAKLGWTDVASFWEHQIPATNYGPGDPLLAHHKEERIDRESLELANTTLRRLLNSKI